MINIEEPQNNHSLFKTKYQEIVLYIGRNIFDKTNLLKGQSGYVNIVVSKHLSG